MTDADKRYQEALRAIQDRIEAAIIDNETAKSYVIYSAYPVQKDPEEIPIDNLDDVAVEGRVQFRQESDDFFGNGLSYKSGVVKNPTWMDVAVLANAMIIATDDQHHVFLENIRLADYGQDANGPFSIYEFVMGS